MDEPGTTMTRRHSAMVTGASIAGAVSNLVMMFITTRTLADPVEQAEALAFWSLLVGLAAVVSGVQNESTRAVGSSHSGTGGRAQSMMLPAVLVVSAVLAGLMLLLSPWITSRVLSSHPVASMVLLVLSAACWPLQALAMGSLAGRRRWMGFSSMITGEVVLRALFVVAVAAGGVSLLGYQLAMAAAVPVMVAGVAVGRLRRIHAAATSDASFRLTVRRLLLAVLSAGAVALMTTAYPALMKSAMPEVSNVAAWMLAVSITRAPIMIPIYTFQQVAITRFIERPREPFRALAAPLALVAAAGVMSALGMAILGPWFLALFDPDFQFTWLTLGVLTLASAMVAVLVLFSAAVLAANEHGWYAGSWLAASAISIAVLYWSDDWPVFTRLITSLVAGPLVGGGLILVVLLRLAVRNRRSRDHQDAASLLSTDSTP